MTKKVFIGTTLLCVVLFFISCSKQEVIKEEVAKEIVILQKCEFKLENIVNCKVAGIYIDMNNKISSIKDIPLLDAAKLVKAFNNKSFPVNFTLNLAIINPNNGLNGTTKTIVTLENLDWTLLIGGVETISGIVNQSIEIPGSAYTKTVIPLEMGVDLYEFFGDKDYESVISIALAIVGSGSSAGRLTLNGKPTISTPFGPIEYPNEIQIIEKEFRAN